MLATRQSRVDDGQIRHVRSGDPLETVRGGRTDDSLARCASAAQSRREVPRHLARRQVAWIGDNRERLGDLRLRRRFDDWRLGLRLLFRRNCDPCGRDPGGFMAGFAAPGAMPQHTLAISKDRMGIRHHPGRGPMRLSRRIQLAANENSDRKPDCRANAQRSRPNAPRTSQIVTPGILGGRPNCCATHRPWTLPTKCDLIKALRLPLDCDAQSSIRSGRSSQEAQSASSAALSAAVSIGRSVGPSR